MELGGIAAISDGLSVTIYLSECNIRSASSYAGELGAMLLRRGSA